MISTAVRLKTIAFVIVAVLVVFHIGTRYADLGRHVGLDDDYPITVELAETGGLVAHADVTYLGVSIGRVGAVDLTPSGVLARLRINDSAPRIPADVRAVVANRSAVGEQYIDLRPVTGGAPYLAAGHVVPRSATSTPRPVTDVLASVDELVASVPLEALQTVVHELGQAFHGQGPNLQGLLDHGGDFVAAADLHIEPTGRLLDDGEKVLRTQNEEAGSLISFSRDARLLAAQLRSSDTDLRKLIIAAPRASTEFAGLLRDLDPELSVLLANLLTTSELLRTRTAGLEELLVKTPAAVAAGSSMIENGRLNFGMVTTFFDPPQCTEGYGGTSYRNGLDVTAGPALNTGARCAMPASTGVNVRGAANAPRGGVPVPARPGSLGVTGGPGPLPGALGLVPPGARQPTDMRGLLGLPAAPGEGD